MATVDLLAECPPVPWSETDRLKALRSYAVLDLDETDVFKDFVQIASDICDAPVAVVNLIDSARQWFAAEIGLGVRHMPRDVSICAHAILQPGVFVVPDLAEDSRFAANPLVAGAPHLRFYGGALLETPEGLPLGTVCVLDFKPRPEGLTERQVFTLKALARQVMTQLELRRSLAAHRRVESEKDLLIAQKDLLIQEVDHRVKNSLSMVQSLLLIQGRDAATPDAARQLKESAGRVHTIAAMHDLLYRSATASHIDTADYLNLLLAEQRKALGTTQPDRAIVISADSVIWPASQIPTLGLITVELVTNALKYGIGTVSVSFQQEGSEASLTVDDEGGVLPEDFDPTACTGLGLRLICNFLHARQGTLTATLHNGHTRFVARLAAPI